jgi:formate dehydrogenase maturation protein FdhE
MRDLDYPFIRCVRCAGITLSPRSLCTHCEAQKAAVRGHCSYCQELVVLTHQNLHQAADGTYALTCEDCEEKH